MPTKKDANMSAKDRLSQLNSHLPISSPSSPTSKPFSINASRIAQIEATIHKWNGSFSHSVTSDDAWKATQEVYHEKAEWYDHGFFVVRKGPKALFTLRNGFLYINNPFQGKILKILPTSEGAAVQMLWVGKSANDLRRPNGPVLVKANNRDFQAHVGFFIQIDEAGKITRIDEYDHRYWNEGQPAEKYTVMT